MRAFLLGQALVAKEEEEAEERASLEAETKLQATGVASLLEEVDEYMLRATAHGSRLFGASSSSSCQARFRTREKELRQKKRKKRRR